MPISRTRDAAVGADDNCCPSCGEPVEDPADRPPNGATSDVEADARSEPTSGETRGRKLTVAGVGLSGIGAFLPWVEVQAVGTTATRTGIEGDGRITIALATVAGIALLVGRGKPWTRRSRGLLVVLGALVGPIGVVYLVDPTAGADVSSDAEDFVRRGSGLYLTAIGGGLLALGPLYATFGGGE